MSNDGVNAGRRRFLVAATSVVGAAGAVEMRRAVIAVKNGLNLVNARASLRVSSRERLRTAQRFGALGAFGAPAGSFSSDWLLQDFVSCN